MASCAHASHFRFQDMYLKMCIARYVMQDMYSEISRNFTVSYLHHGRVPVFHDIDINHFSSLYFILWFNVETWWSQDTIEKKKMVLICHKDLAKFYTTAVTIYICGRNVTEQKYASHVMAKDLAPSRSPTVG